MAKSRCIWGLWILSSLVAFAARGGLGFRILAGLIGTDTVVNNVGNDMTIRNLARSGDTNQPDLGDVPLAKGRSYEYLVVSGITSVTSWCVAFLPLLDACLAVCLPAWLDAFHAFLLSCSRARAPRRADIENLFRMLNCSSTVALRSFLPFRNV